MTEETCWTLIEDAAGGDAHARDAFARLYLPVVQAYVGARWRGTPLRSVVDDAVQDVFLDLVRPNGALARARRDHDAGGFRAFLYGVARNVARRHEERAQRRDRRETRLDTRAAVPSPSASPSRAFEIAWARAIMRAARDRHAAMVREKGPDPDRQVDLLRLRFGDGLPIRDIAARWGEDPAAVHRRYRRARREFAAALYETVAQHVSGTPAEIKRECARLLDILR